MQPLHQPRLTVLLFHKVGHRSGVAEDGGVLGLERGLDFLVVLVAEGLDDALDLHVLDGRGEPGALVVDVLDGGAELRERARQLGDAAGAVGHGGDEAHEAAVGGEAAVDDAAEHGGVDVTAAERDDDVLALELRAVQGAAGEQAREARRAAALADDLLGLDEAQHGLGHHELRHGDGLVHEVVADLEGGGAHDGHGEAVGERRLHQVRRHGRAVVERGLEGRAEVRLHAVDLDGRHERLDGEGHAGDEAGAAHGDHDGVGVGHLLEDLDGHGAGAGDDLGVVVAVDVALVRALALQEGLGLADVGAVDDDLGAEAAAAAHLGERRHGGHGHGHGDAQLRAVPGERERVVAGGRRAHAVGALLLGERPQAVGGAALLEGTRELHEVLLQVDVGAGELGEDVGPRGRGTKDGFGFRVRVKGEGLRLGLRVRVKD
mmetsp:Transcript_10563/g.31882  ORF Transcript_10563/g.31882 Transcript_10563/m.31882 type:complete len:433 (+) Transcript_10563:76-1374(+)